MTSHSAHDDYHHVLPFLKNIPIIWHFSFPKNLKSGVSSPFIKSKMLYIGQLSTKCRGTKKDGELGGGGQRKNLRGTRALKPHFILGSSSPEWASES